MFDVKQLNGEVVAILRGIEAHEVVAHATLMWNAGLRYLEVPLNTASGLDSLQALVKAAPTRVHIGAGSVVRTEQVDAIQKMAVGYALAPWLDASVMRHAIGCGIAFIPGVATPTEAWQAQTLGAAALKAFPAAELGMGFAKALTSVSICLPLMAVGGVGLSATPHFFDQGYSSVGMGSTLYKAGQTLEQTRRNVAELLETWVPPNRP